MTIEEAEAEYNRLLSKQSTPSELATGLEELRRRKDKINISYYPLCDNDNGDEPYP
uniref:Uncharacterized protein n=1 Tax=viral metagenome TaxID=1070528 RepID=A0A6H1ZGZ2_9ZZZZ